MSVLISADELVEQLQSGSGPTPVLLDVRWSLQQPDGRADYLAGHLPGAVFVDLEGELSRQGKPTEGRHPLPSSEELQAAARGWGINQDSTVVIYDNWNSFAAARAWWLLRNAGLAQVLILDGGLQAWQQAGGALETGEVHVPAGDVTLSSGHLASINIDQAAQFPAHGLLLDARAGERYRGEVEPVDPRAGHIPGAFNSPTSENVDAHGKFLSPTQLAARFTALGLNPSQPLAVYCGSGVTAAHHIAALEIAGFSAALFPGSWSAWSNHPDRPVATGANA